MGSRNRISGYHPSCNPNPHKGQQDKETLKAQGFYHKPAWRKIRRQALQRDHYLCQNCLRSGKITQATEVHHIMELESFPSLALELSNLESLCWQCHEDTKHTKDHPHIPGVRIIRITGKNDGENVGEKEEGKSI